MVTLLLELGCAGSPHESVTTTDTAPTDSAPVDTAPEDTGDTAPASHPPLRADTHVVDRDGDGFVVGDDCDDDNPYVYPGAAELCDALDQDCDGEPLAPGVCGGMNYLTGAIVPIATVSDLQYYAGGSITADLTGDGHPDVISGPAFESEDGDNLDAVWDGAVLPERALPFPEGAVALIVDPVGFEDHGSARLNPGDIDGDGAPDVAFFSDTSSALYVFSGPLAQDHRMSFFEATYVWASDLAVDAYGNPASALGDINADGCADIAFGAEEYSEFGTDSWTEIVFGSSTADGVSSQLRHNGWDATVLNIGDLDADGLSELLYLSVYTTILEGGTLAPDALLEVSDLTLWEWESTEDDNGLSGSTEAGTTGDWDGDGSTEIYIGRATSHAGDGTGALFFFQAPFERIATYDDASGAIVADADIAGMASAIMPMRDTGSGSAVGLYVYADSEDPVLIRNDLPVGVVPLSETQHVWYQRGPKQPAGMGAATGEDLDGDGLTDVTGSDRDFGLVGYIPGFIPPWDDPTYW